MPNIQIFVGIKAWDARGRLTHDVTEESKSLVQAFLAAMLAAMSNSTLGGTHPDTGGSARTLTIHSGNNLLMYRAKGLVNDATEGIVIGTDATVVDITDNQLVAQIAEGTGSGQMTHQAQTYDSNITISDPDATFSTARTFNNNSGGSITVKETGIYAAMTRTVSTLSDFCMVRDVPTELVVADSGLCQVTYTFKISE